MPAVNDVGPGFSGRLRVALNMGNPILTSSVSSLDLPAGLAVDLSHALSKRLGAEPVFIELPTAAACMRELTTGNADISFMAVDPARAEDVRFSSPYMEIAGAFAVRRNSTIQTNIDVDQHAQQVVVGVGSAYDLFLSRYLKNADLHRIPLSEQVINEMLNGQYTAAAGIRRQLEDLILPDSDVRLLEENFMVIQQAIANSSQTTAINPEQVESFLSWAISSGYIQESLSKHGVTGVRIAQPRS